MNTGGIFNKIVTMIAVLYARYYFTLLQGYCILFAFRAVQEPGVLVQPLFYENWSENSESIYDEYP